MKRDLLPFFPLNRLSDEASCMDSLDVEKLNRVNSAPMTVRNGATREKYDRPMVLVARADADGVPTKFYYADQRTGSLYDGVTGRCLSAPHLSLKPGHL